MIDIRPVTLEGHQVRLEPLGLEHRDGLAAAAADGELWRLWFTAVPEPAQTENTSPTPSPVTRTVTCCPGRFAS